MHSSLHAKSLRESSFSSPSIDALFDLSQNAEAVELG